MNHYYRNGVDNAAGWNQLVTREKPAGAGPTKYIVGGTLAGVIVFTVIGIATWFHFKRRKEDKLDVKQDEEELDDYGLGDSNDTDDIKRPAPKPETHTRGEDPAAGGQSADSTRMGAAAEGSGELLMPAAGHRPG